jgi:hypothetical protein
MPIGTGSFIPSGRFSTTRSYFRGIGFDISGYTVLSTANAYYWQKISDPNEVWTIVVDERFWLWSSNHWTLDHIITDFYYTLYPSPTQNPQPYTLQPWLREENLSPYLLLQFAAVDFGEFHYVDFPAAPPGYWRPGWLP